MLCVIVATSVSFPPGERLTAQVTPLDVAVRETIELFRSGGPS